MNAPPILSVVIPSHRRTDRLAACLQSIQFHSPKEVDVIVIDDGSPNGGASEVANRFAGVRCHRFNRSRGFCAAANQGLRMATAPVVQLLNDDTEVTAGWAEAALAVFTNSQVAAVAPLILRWPGDAIDSAGDHYDAGGFAQPRWRGNRIGSLKGNTSQSVLAASACGAFYRREVVMRIGGFAKSFGAYFEDVDLSCRLRRAGYSIEFVPASRILHHGSSSYGPPRGRLLERQSCNEERLFWRNQSGTPHELIRHAAVVFAKAIRRWNEGRLVPWLCGRLRALAMLPMDLTGRWS